MSTTGDLQRDGTAPFHAPSFYPNSPEAALKLEYVGKHINDVQAPAVIIDVAVARRNCRLMLDTTKKLGVGFRAHVKTHKTIQLAKLQVGEDSMSVKMVASTVAEVENLLPWLLECKNAGKQVNVLYGLPVNPSATPRLGSVARILGEGSIGLFVDHPAQAKLLDEVPEESWPGRIPVFVKIDVGYQRAGVTAESSQLADLAYAVSDCKRIRLCGFYSHMGHSYAVGSPEEALQALSKEIQGLEEGALSFLKSSGASETKDPNAQKLTLSLGATPTATASQNLIHDSDATKEYRAMIEKANQSFSVELHAGVFPVMDMQQLATHARPQSSKADPDQSLLSFKDLGLRTLVEVASVYQDRERPEALIAAGSIVLGREPCKSYPGWGVVAPWPDKDDKFYDFYDPEGSRTGWIVGRISQEHGTLTWEGSQEHFRKLQFGQKLLVWPNHACMNGPNFGWYVVVDSDSPDPNIVRDVWVRWRGW